MSDLKRRIAGFKGIATTAQRASAANYKDIEYAREAWADADEDMREWLATHIVFYQRHHKRNHETAIRYIGYVLRLQNSS